MALSPESIVAGKYRIRRQLGAGGMGAVYVATNLSTEADVALKVMSDHLHMSDEAVRRFQQEARAAAKVKHPGIVRIFDMGQEGHQPWIAMELLEGESLATRLQRGPLSAHEVVLIFSQLLDLLKQVHVAGIVHRDLKPDNLFLERSGSRALQVRLLDFGIAKLSDSKLGTYATQAGFAMGTLGYMAPEQTMHATSVDERSDIYAIGAMLYECLSGNLPYPAESLGALIHMHFKERPAALTLSPDLKPYERIARSCLSIKLADRPSDCDSVEALFARIPSPKSDFSSDAELDGVVTKSFAARAWALGAVAALTVAAGAFYLHNRKIDTKGAAPSPVVEARAKETRQVDVKVESDLPGGELVVDGQSHGMTDDGKWALKLAPGTHRFAALVRGETIATQTMVVEEPATFVRLSAPANNAPAAEMAKTSLQPEKRRKRPQKVDEIVGAEVPKEELEEMPKTLSSDQLAAVVHRNRGPLQRCYESALRANGGQTTRPIQVQVDLVASPRGMPSSVKVSGEEMQDLHKCLRGIVFGWIFPRAQTATQFTFPVVFQTAE